MVSAIANTIHTALEVKCMEENELPVGFAMALAMNPEAMKAFAMLSEQKKQEIIAGTHSIRFGEEMHRYVNGLLSHPF